jgi:hypothetical protein
MSRRHVVMPVRVPELYARAASHAGSRATVRWAAPGKTMGHVRYASRAASALWPWAARYCATGLRWIRPVDRGIIFLFSEYIQIFANSKICV